MRIVALVLALLLGGCVIYEDRDVIPRRDPVSVEDVIRMKQDGATDGALLSEIYGNGVRRRPSADDIVAMKIAGVSDRVVKAMIDGTVTTAREEQVITRRTVVYSNVAEDVAILGIGALLGYAVGHHYHHRHYHGCGHRW